MSAPGAATHPLVALLRSFTVDWLAMADPEGCRRTMAPGYTATVGGVTLAGREESYLPATMAQLQRFPGLLVTVHDLFTDGDTAAMRFTEHGWSTERGAAAAWAGIGIFGWDGDRLTVNVSEEDYLSRRHQFGAGVADPVARPATAPWAAQPVPPASGAGDAVRTWLAAGDLTAGGGVALDDGWVGRPTPKLLDQEAIEIDAFVVAGRRVGFHATQRGAYLGGLDLPDPPVGAAASLRCIGMVDVGGDGRISGYVVQDRVGLRRDLIARAGGGG